MAVKIELSANQIQQALVDYIRTKGYIASTGVHLKEKRNMDTSWFEAWAWVDKDLPPTVIPK